ncbi:replication initiation protein [Pasteurella multocida]|uniref:replication initiation protein n=1 Tax=Pasteurella multocida TaxID=747 RepID=UPI0022FFC4EF|nr:replication initiation protein [Pasteurella multocida]MDA5614057.1 replication initiation protein [Pasteurella multocida]MDA5621732.1 replication initiation protein [Pasteurella multocida subsp. multocida]
MSELIIYKANDLVVSRYDLTEQETKLILVGISKLNNSLINPTEKDLTVSIPYVEFAKIMSIPKTLAWTNLNNAVKNLMSKVIEVVNPDPNSDVSKVFFQWVSYAEFNENTQSVDLVFHKKLQPFLFNMKKFIKYKLNNVKSLNNKYSMRTYEILLKSLGEKKLIKSDVVIELERFKEMLVLEANYPEFKHLNQRVLKVIIKDINENSDLKVSVKTQGRPVDTLIFSVEKVKQLDLVNEIDRQEQAEFPQVEPIPPKKRKTIQQETDDMRIKKLMLILGYHENSKIALSQAELGLLKNMHKHYYAHGNFVIQGKLTAKTLDFLDSVLHKYLPRLPSRKM